MFGFSSRAALKIATVLGAWSFLAAVLLACESTAQRTALSTSPGGAASTNPVEARSTQSREYSWQERIASPSSIEPPEGYQTLSKRCARFDAGLTRVAAEVATRQAAGAPAMASEELAFALRAAGVPQVWPRLWTISGRGLDKSDVLRRIDAWLVSTPKVGELRCGISEAKVHEGSLHDSQVIAMVAVDALADLAPLPIRTREGEWLRLDAKMLVSSSAAKVVVLGPTGQPQSVPTSLSQNHVKAVVHPDRDGMWLLQVLTTTVNGPRPVLEALVFSGTEPPSNYTDQSAPGEAMSEGVTQTDVALERMVNTAREGEGLHALARSAALDRVAQKHAMAMQQAHQVAHDLGDGDPQARLAATGIAAAMTGENVAYAKDVQAGHRALWSSPSHRGNMLQPRFDTLGIGVAKDEDGSVWLCELFANLGGAGN